jgi:ribosomal protein S18 acetylase RimI-like enzyme
MSDQIRIREAEPKDLNRCFLIEAISYEADEAASKEKILKRIINYPEGFVVLEINNEIVGFINSGATNEVKLSDEEFKELVGHDPAGKHVVIMSVVVHPDHQGNGYADQLMVHFISKMENLKKSTIYLICQLSLIRMYERHGFVLIGKSESSHGGLEWHEMSMTTKKHISG